MLLRASGETALPVERTWALSKLRSYRLRRARGKQAPGFSRRGDYSSKKLSGVRSSQSSGASVQTMSLSFSTFQWCSVFWAASKTLSVWTTERLFNVAVTDPAISRCTWGSAPELGSIILTGIQHHTNSRLSYEGV